MRLASIASCWDSPKTARTLQLLQLEGSDTVKLALVTPLRINSATALRFAALKETLRAHSTASYDRLPRARKRYLAACRSYLGKRQGASPDSQETAKHQKHQSLS